MVFEAHYLLLSIHSFADGNGRTTRLLMNAILLMTAYSVAIIREHDLLAYIDLTERRTACQPESRLLKGSPNTILAKKTQVLN